VLAVPVERDDDRPYAVAIAERQRVHHRAIPATWKVSGAYVNSYLADREAQAAGYDTGLMLDVHGRVAEASTANVLFVVGDELVTPRLDGDVFPGITRAMLLRVAAELGLRVSERDIRPAELERFEAAIACGTLMELRPIDRLGHLFLRSSAHPTIRRTVARFREITHQ
jgi:branched-chain amino acid aminotransferase